MGIWSDSWYKRLNSGSWTMASGECSVSAPSTTHLSIASLSLGLLTKCSGFPSPHDNTRGGGWGRGHLSTKKPTVILHGLLIAIFVLNLTCVNVANEAETAARARFSHFVDVSFFSKQHQKTTPKQAPWRPSK